jgi:hypothetical protein
MMERADSRLGLFGVAALKKGVTASCLDNQIRLRGVGNCRRFVQFGG